MSAGIGMSLNEGCLERMRRGITPLQPIRGDKYSGIAFLTRNGIINERDEEGGFIDKVIQKAISRAPSVAESQAAIGGVDYIDSQPKFIEKSKIGPFAIAGDVKIVNRDELSKKYPYLLGSDIRLCAGLIGGSSDPAEGLATVIKEVRGRFALIVLTTDGVFACKDPRGFNSLVIARNEKGYCAVCSESLALGAAFDDDKTEILREVYPSEIIQVKSTGFQSLKRLPSPGLVMCPFSVGYGQGPASIFEDIDIGFARTNMGATLAQKYGVPAQKVFPFPLSGNSAEEGYAEESRMPHINVWEYHSLGRSYLRGTEQERRERGRDKYSPIQWVLKKYKTFIGVDDSIVEGNQFLARIFLLHALLSKFHPLDGERGIHIRIACPPKVNGCPLEAPEHPTEKLFAASRSKEEMRKELKVKSLEFNTIDDFVEAILNAQSEKRKTENPITSKNLCLCCFERGEDLIKKYLQY